MKTDFIAYGFWIIFAGVALNFGYQVIKRRGLKAALFGAPIERTVGELDLGRTSLLSTKLKVHCLESSGPASPTVGIEVVNTSVASYQMTPIRLTSQQASALKELLSQAIAQSKG